MWLSGGVLTNIVQPQEQWRESLALAFCDGHSFYACTHGITDLQAISENDCVTTVNRVVYERSIKIAIWVLAKNR